MEAKDSSLFERTKPIMEIQRLNVGKLLLLPFLLMMVANFFLPETPIWDERLFYPTLKEIGKNYLPSIDQIKYLNSPMGPLYFIIWGFIGKIFSFSLPYLRFIHILFSLFFIILIYRLFKGQTEYPVLLCGLFVINPYFLIMTGPLLYTDVTSMIFLFIGLYNYLSNGNRWYAGIFLGLAICTRQLLIIFPLAIGLADLYWVYKKKIKAVELVKDFIPIFIFLPLFFLWDYNVNSGHFSGKQFEENTLAAFHFSLKRFNYVLLLVGLYSIPLWITSFKKLFRGRYYQLALLLTPLLLFGFPLKVNANLPYGGLPDTAGLFDIIFVKLGVFSYILVPIFFIVGCFILNKMFFVKNTFKTLFYKIAIILFVILESIYSYCWDKHFLPIIPILFLLSYIASREEYKEVALVD